METPAKSLKIAFVSTMGGVAWGGSEELWSLTALRLRGLGHRVSALVYRWPTVPSRVAELQAAGVEVSFRARRLGFIEDKLEKLRQRLSPAPLDSKCMEWLERERPDLLVISQSYAWDGVAWMTACLAAGIPYCPIVHAHGELWWPDDAELPPAVAAFTGARRAFFVSRANFQLMELQCGRRLKNGEVVVNPWNVDASSPATWPANSDRLELACVGRMDPRAKGQDLLIQVMALPKWRERPVRVNFYGEGPCVESIKALATLLGVENVAFHGQVGDVKSIWTANHALVLPSRFEGLPLVIVEAMFCGRLVITTDIAGNAQYLREGRNGFIAAAPTVALLDDAMERAWARKEEWREIGAAARQDLEDAIPADPIGVMTGRLLELLASNDKPVAVSR